MITKKKICDSCQKEKHIWKNNAGKRYCKFCWHKQKPASFPKQKTRIKPVSKKRQDENKEYTKLRLKFLMTNINCQAKLIGCTKTATDIHHTFWGSDRSKYFLDTSTWKSICRNCHSITHDKLTAEEAIKLELKNFKREQQNE